MCFNEHVLIFCNKQNIIMNDEQLRTEQMQEQQEGLRLLWRLSILTLVTLKCAEVDVVHSGTWH